MDYGLMCGFFDGFVVRMCVYCSCTRRMVAQVQTWPLAVFSDRRLEFRIDIAVYTRAHS